MNISENFKQYAIFSIIVDVVIIVTLALTIYHDKLLNDIMITIFIMIGINGAKFLMAIMFGALD